MTTVTVALFLTCTLFFYIFWALKLLVSRANEADLWHRTAALQKCSTEIYCKIKVNGYDYSRRGPSMKWKGRRLNWKKESRMPTSLAAQKSAEKNRFEDEVKVLSSFFSVLYFVRQLRKVVLKIWPKFFMVWMELGREKWKIIS